MALKFRRGTTAQKSGSLAFGEPYVNTDLGTLQIGGASGDITLGAANSQGSFTGISGSSLDITGNAKIDGNLTLGGTITIGDNTSDNVVVNADLSSSIIPNDDNAFDLGAPSKRYRSVYGNIISGSAIEIMSGSNPELRLINKTTGIEYHIQNGDGGNFQIHNGNTGNLLFKFISGSITDGNQDGQFYGNLIVSKSVLASNINQITTFTGSTNSRLTNLELNSSSVNASITSIVSSTSNINAFTASQTTTESAQNARLLNLETTTASLNGHVTDINTKTGSFETKFSTLSTYTASIDSKFTTIAGVTASFNNATASLNTFTASQVTTESAQNARLTNLENATASLFIDTINLEAFSASQITKDSTLQTYTASIDTKFSTLQTYTASVDSKFTTLQSLTASNANRLSRLEESTASLNTFSASINGHVADINTWTASAKLQLTDIQNYTSSLRAAITASGVDVTINGNTTVKGNLFVQGTQTVVDSTTVNIADNILVLNAAGTSDGGLQVRDASGGSTTSGSLLWDVTNDYWKAGKSGSESQLLTAGGMGIISGSNQITAVLTSLNSYTSSQDTKNTTLQTYTASVDSKFTTIAGVTASFNNATASLNTFSASTLGHITDINTKTGSFENKFTTLGTYTASVDAKILRIQESTASLNTFTASNGIISLNTFTQSTTLDLARLHESTASLNTFSASNGNTSLNTFSASTTLDLARLHESTASLNSFTASISLKTGSYSTTGSNTFIGNQTIIGGGSGFAAYISTSVNDGTLGLDTTANVNAAYFLKNGTKNFEVSYDTTNANGIFRLLPYNNNSFFEIGNPSNSANSNTDYVFVAESTYGNVLLGPGIGNATAYLIGATPLTDKVQITGNTFVSGAVKANSFTGSIAATNGVVSGSSQVIGILSSLNTYTGSNDTTNTAQNSRLTNLESATASLFIDTINLEAFSASQITKDSTLQTYTASIDTKFSTLQTYTASVDSKFTTLQSLTASNANRLSRLEESTASLNSFTASNAITSLNTFTASNGNTSLNSYTSSNDTTNTTQNNRLSRLEESTASLNALTSSYARTNTTNTFNGTQTISGSLYITQDLIVGGSSSIQNISSSRLDIGDNVIQLNVNNPVLRFGGLAVFDSGSAGGSGSLLYDSVDDEWVFVHKGNGTNVTSSHVVMGPETYDNLGNEIYMTSNRIPKVTNYEHLGDSNITDTGTLITLGSNTVVAGTIVASGTALVSSSAQINYTQLSGISANIISASTDSSNVDFIISGGSITANLYGGVVSGSAQIVSVLTSLNSYTGSNDTTNTAQNSRLTNLETTTSSLATTYEGRASASKTIFSGSSQVDHNATTNYSANRHIDHTAVSITAGNGLSGGGDISTTRTLSLDTTSATFTTGVTTQNNVLGVVSGSKTISGVALGSNLNTLTIGTGLSGTSYNGSAAVTIANTGVLSITSNTGLSSNVSATGNVTITNTGVTSNVAGTGVSVSGATGAVTISIGQAVATSSNVQFNSIGVGVAASATAGRIDASGDIVAYSSSDRNFKENITPIPNALEKISKISGNTYDWKAELKDVHGYEGNDVGVIAQEIEEVLPQVVTTRDNGYKAVKYEKLVALLIEGIKEQQTQIHKLTLEVENLKKQKGL